MGKAFSKMSRCNFGLKQVKRIALCKDQTQFSSDQVPASNPLPVPKKQVREVATAESAYAEAALAIERARVGLSKGGGGKTVAGDLIALPQHVAATEIQKVYRGHLARRAFRALKSLVKVQALFRGHRVRKMVAAVRFEALIRAQANVPDPAEHVCRSPNYMSPTMSSKAKSRPSS